MHRVCGEFNIRFPRYLALLTLLFVLFIGPYRALSGER